MNQFPLVSVVMAVKDGEELVGDSIGSILNQTYKNFELIIINDGSKDQTLKVIDEFSDPRIKVFSQENQGLARALNRGLKTAEGLFIARQDHDDLSHPDRLSRQVDFLLKNSSYGLVGSAAEIWEGNRFLGRYHDHPTNPGLLKFELIFNNPFVHSSIMFRSALLSDIGFYTEDRSREPPEDYEYISRVSRKYDVANLSDRLVVYREVPHSLSSQIRPNKMEDGISNFLVNLARISNENIRYESEQQLLGMRFGELVHYPVKNITGSISIDAIRGCLKDAAGKLYLKYGEKEIIWSCNRWCTALSIKSIRIDLAKLDRRNYLEQLSIRIKLKIYNQVLKIQKLLF